MQQRQDDGRCRRIGDGQRGGRRDHRSFDIDADGDGRTDTELVLAQRGQRADSGIVGMDPAPVSGDANGTHCVAIGVERGHDMGGGRSADIMLGRLAAEQDDEVDARRQ